MKIRLPRDPRRGFTLLELLIVLVIIVLVTAAALPVVLPALANRKVSEGARVFQAVLAGVRDQAIRAGEPRGVRLLPSVMHDGSGETLAYNRMIAIEPGPDYSEGRVTVAGDPAIIGPTPPPNHVAVVAPFLPFQPVTFSGITPSILPNTDPRLAIYQSQGKTDPITNTFIPDTPTGWYWNIRQGDKIVIGDTGRAYTIAGPLYKKPAFPDGNIERFINPDPRYTATVDPTSSPFRPEVLYLVNGQDDDGDGWIDESFDGLDNDFDGIVDPGFNGIDDDGDGVIDNPEEMFWNATTRSYTGTEYEQEQFVGASLATSQIQGDYSSQKYLIKRRAVVSPQAKEVYLPDGVMIDATSWNAIRTTGTAMPERSRLPIDPFSRTVDVMLMPSGAAVPPSGPDSLNSPSTYLNVPFYHFWICDAADVLPGVWQTPRPANWPTTVPLQNPNSPLTYTLAMPKGTVGLTNGTPYTGGQAGNVFLEGERRLVTLFTKTGQVSTSRIEIFDTEDVNKPYYDVQTGVTEEP